MNRCRHTHTHTFFHYIITEEAGKDGGWQRASGQQDARQHGEFHLLRLTEGFQKEKQLSRTKDNIHKVSMLYRF